MQLVKFSIRRSVTVTMIYLIVVGFGLFGLSQLKLALFPDISMDTIMVNTTYTGVGPEEIEELLTRPIEEAVAATENVDTVSSESMNGTSTVTLEFTDGTDMDQAEIDVRNKLDQIRDYLPDDAQEPIVMAFDSSMMPILLMLVSSPNLGIAELRNLVEDQIEPLLERVEGVASVSTMGGLTRQINVKLNPVLLASYKRTAQDVISALQKGGKLYPAGSIQTSTRQYNLRVYSEYRSVTQIENVILMMQGDVPVRLKDVAEVGNGYEEQTSDVRVNSGQGVMLSISKQSDANTLQAVQNVKKALPSVMKNLPEGTEFTIMMDQSSSIESSINNLSTTAIQAFILAVIVIYLFLLNWRGSLIMSFSMPISVIATFGVLMLADITLNLISMAGLALAIGMLVDNSIVVLENIFRHRDMGKPIAEAADIGTSEVGMAIMASTLTTVVVFLPVLFVPGMSGELFRDMVLTISFSLGVSIIVALTLVPMMASKILDQHDKGHPKRKGIIKRLMEGILNGLARLYQATLRWAIHHKVLTLLAVIVVFGLSLLLVPSLGMDFIPGMDQTTIQVTLQQAAGVPLTTLRQTAMQLEQIVKEEAPEVKSIYLSFGSQGGFRASGSSEITLYAMITEKEERTRSQFEIENALRKRFDTIPGLTYSVQQTSGPTSGGSAIEINIRGYDTDTSLALAEQFQAQMQQIAGLVDIELNVKESVPQLEVELNQDILNDFLLSDTTVAALVSTSIAGATAATYREGGDEYDINVRLAEAYRQDREALGDLLIPVNNGASLIPLNQLGTVEESRAASTIYRENQERYVSVACNLAPGLDLGTARQQIEALIAATPIPENLTVSIGGTAEEQQKSMIYYAIAFLVSVVLVYMVMASQFESLVDPFIIMFTVPLCIIGVIGMLYLTHTSLSIMALVGIVMLVGISVNNGIVLVDYMNQLHAKGVDLYEAVKTAGADRFRPVLMTASTTILGMVPMALEIGTGSELWSPLARAVIGGLVSTTLLTLLVIPVLYIIFERLAERIKKLFAPRALSEPEIDMPTPLTTVE